MNAIEAKVLSTSVTAREKVNVERKMDEIYKHIEETAAKQPDVRGLRLYVMRHNQVGMKVYQKLSMENSGYIVYEKDFT